MAAAAAAVVVVLVVAVLPAMDDGCRDGLVVGVFVVEEGNDRISRPVSPCSLLLVLWVGGFVGWIDRVEPS